MNSAHRPTAILVAGIPATGKSTFARYLARKHGFAHYDLECYPRGWLHPELKPLWDADRRAFVAAVSQWGEPVVLDWGFPVTTRSWVEELQDCGVRLIWFDGDIARARLVFIQRDGIPAAFDSQVAEIKAAGYPASLNCTMVPALSANGDFLGEAEIEHIVFPSGL